MNELDLSEDAIRLLEANGYTFHQNKRHITIKKPSNNLGEIITPIFFTLLSVPLIISFSWIGLMVSFTLAAVWLLTRKRFSKTSKLNIYPREEYIEFIKGRGKDKYTFWYIRSLFLRSKLDHEVQPMTSRNHDGTLTVGVELRSRQFLDLLFFNSDYIDNAQEMNEIHQFFRTLFREK